ncbi:MAG: DUF1848 domain-containing protein [Solobacterium sp.]|nr:DUF1848 domain-containing protein [Solobacterium sp.]
MIINTGQRTDIPAFYAEWFANRLKEGMVCVRSPYRHELVTRFRLDPDTVDLIVFGTKKPKPFFPYLHLLADYGQLWHMTLTPYGKDMEPNVPDKHELIRTFQELSRQVGKHRIVWRYDPVFLSEKYSLDYHLRAFRTIASELAGYTDTVVISFIDLYAKVLKNYPDVREVSLSEQITLGKELIRIAGEYGMKLKTCVEGTALEPYGADCSGCARTEDLEKALGKPLSVPKYTPGRKICTCYLSNDIGAYDTCMHLCRYCYANSDAQQVRKNHAVHDPASPFLLGNYEEGDIVRDAQQRSWIDQRLRLL